MSLAFSVVLTVYVNLFGNYLSAFLTRSGPGYFSPRELDSFEMSHIQVNICDGFILPHSKISKMGKPSFEVWTILL